jgi:hypothetical protein
MTVADLPLFHDGEESGHGFLYELRRDFAKGLAASAGVRRSIGSRGYEAQNVLYPDHDVRPPRSGCSTRQRDYAGRRRVATWVEIANLA